MAASLPPVHPQTQAERSETLFNGARFSSSSPLFFFFRALNVLSSLAQGCVANADDEAAVSNLPALMTIS